MPGSLFRLSSGATASSRSRPGSSPAGTIRYTHDAPGLEDLAGWPWVDYDGAAPADGDTGSRASLFELLHDLHRRTGRRAGTVIRAAPAGPFPMASGPYLAWLPLKFLHAFDPDLRPLPVSFGRHRYRTGFIARRSAEDLAAFRLLRQAVRDAALEKSGRPPR